MYANNSYIPGVVLKVPSAMPAVWHFGIIDGSGYVIHALKERGVVRSTLEEFSGGNEPIMVQQPRSAWQAAQWIQRAQSKMGQPYVLITDNCEHFVNWVTREAKESPQLQFGLVATALLAGFIWLWRSGGSGRERDDR